MSSTLLQRLSSLLSEVLTVLDQDGDGLTVRHEGSVASLRVVAIADGLELVSLTQPLAWDLPLNNKTRERVAAYASTTMLGSVVLVEKVVEPAANGSSANSATRRSSVKKVADVLLRYNFPAAGLADDALRTLILLVLATGEDIRKDLSPG